MGKKKPKNAKPSPESRFLAAFSPFLDAEGPVMITAWVAMIEYIDADGEHQLSAYASDMPDWRVNGIVQGGHELLASGELFDDWEE